MTTTTTTTSPSTHWHNNKAAQRGNNSPAILLAASRLSEREARVEAKASKIAGELFPRWAAAARYAPLFFFLFLLTACNAPDQAQTRDVKKWNAYVELNNSMIVHFFQPMELYFEAFGRSPEYKTAAEHHDLVQFVSSLTAASDFAKNIAATQSAAKNPQNDLDAAANEMLPHLDTLWKLLTQSRDYHAAQTYTQDDYAQAAALHTRIHQAQAAFAPSHQKFSRLLHQKDAARRKKDIEDMLTQNLRLKPAMLRVVDAAQNMQDYLSQNPESVLKLEPDAFIALCIAYNQAGAAFQILEPLAEELKKETVQPQSLENFRNKVREVSETALPLMAYCQNIQKGEASSTTKLGDIENLSYTIGQLVDSYNLTTK